MPTFYEGDPVVVVDQTLSREEYADAFLFQESMSSLLNRRAVRLLLCLTGAALCASTVPWYLTRYATAWIPAAMAVLLVLLGWFFWKIRPRQRAEYAGRQYDHNQLLGIEEKISVYRDSVIIENPYEEILEYWTDFSACYENERWFALTGGRERGLLFLKKTPENAERMSSHFSSVFAARYHHSGGV